MQLSTQPRVVIRLEYVILGKSAGAFFLHACYVQYCFSCPLVTDAAHATSALQEILLDYGCILERDRRIVGISFIS
jgi:hypothetical protein